MNTVHCLLNHRRMPRVSWRDNCQLRLLWRTLSWVDHHDVHSVCTCKVEVDPPTPIDTTKTSMVGLVWNPSRACVLADRLCSPARVRCVILFCLRAGHTLGGWNDIRVRYVGEGGGTSQGKGCTHHSMEVVHWLYTTDLRSGFPGSCHWSRLMTRYPKHDILYVMS